MLAGNAEFWLGLFIGFVLSCLALACLVIRVTCRDMDKHENQYDPERMA